MPAVESIVARAVERLKPDEASKAIHDLLLFLCQDYESSRILDRTSAGSIRDANCSDTRLEALMGFVDLSRRPSEGILGTELAKVLNQVKDELDEYQKFDPCRQPLIKHEGRFL